MQYYIWDRERNQWWRSRGYGYTSSILVAGRYDAGEAFTIITNATPPGQTVVVPEDQKHLQVWGSPVVPTVDDEDSLTEEYAAWIEKNMLPDEDALTLLAEPYLTDAQQAYLTEFVKRYDAVI